MSLHFLDLFAGGGGLSEGFIRAGFSPIAHVEMNEAACNTLKTRTAFHWLNKQNLTDKYISYINQEISRGEMYSLVPQKLMSSILHYTINEQSIGEIFKRIDELLDNRKIDIIIGGPPCQAYSLVGRARDKNKMKGDQRNYLYTYYAEFLKRYKPYYFVFENVTGLLSARDEEGKLYLNSMKDLFKKVGYETELKVLTANKYGVPQNRKRVILVGRRGRTNGFYPDLVQCYPEALVKDVFMDLKFLKAGEGEIGSVKTKSKRSKYLEKAGIFSGNIPVTFHIARPHTEMDLEIYKIAVNKWNEKKERLNYNDLPEYLKTHRNRSSFTDRFKVVAEDLPYSHTIVAHIARDGHYYIHPDIDQNRSLTPREAARLQTFPDDYYFESVKDAPGRTHAFNQIGNAVPVLLAQKIAEKVLELL